MTHSQHLLMSLSGATHNCALSNTAAAQFAVLIIVLLRQHGLGLGLATGEKSV